MKFYDFFKENNFHDSVATVYKMQNNTNIAIVLAILIWNNKTGIPIGTKYYLIVGDFTFSELQNNPHIDELLFGYGVELFSVKYNKKEVAYLIDSIIGSTCKMCVDEVKIKEIDKQTYDNLAYTEQEYLPEI